MSDPAIITAQNVEKRFGTRTVLAGVSFAVHGRDRIAFVGVNGSGKSTLLRLVVGSACTGGDDEPDAGLVTRRRKLRVEFVAQEPRLDPARSVGDTVREGLREHALAVARLDALATEIAAVQSVDPDALDALLDEQATLQERLSHGGRWDPEHEVRGLSSALGLAPAESRVGALSIGERRRVALARALLAEPDLLALDEPTNHLDARAVEWLEQRLASRAGALLLVTHDRYFLDRVATRILELDRGAMHAYEAGYGAFLERKAERLEVEGTRERERAAYVRRELEWVRKSPSARRTKQQARIDRYEQAVADGRAAQTRGGPEAAKLALRIPTGGRVGGTILELRAVSKSLGGKRLFQDLTLLFKPGDRVGVIGPNGAGKTSLVRTVLGQLEPDSGEVVIGTNTRFAFLDQGRADLRDDATVLDEVSGGNSHVLLEDGPVHARTFLRMMLFEDGFADTPVGVLSGGERNRVQLAKLLRTGGNFLILDEPTNDLDLVTLGVLEESLAAFPGCALIVSHDRWFLDRVATGILAFEGDGQVVFHEGNYSRWLERKAAAEKVAEAERDAASEATRAREGAARAAASAAAAASGEGAAAAAGKKLSWKERQELSTMEGLVEAAEGEVARLEAVLADPGVYQSRGAEVPALVAALEAARAEVERLFARWQELDARPK